MRAKGQVWHKNQKRKGIKPKKPFDKEAKWGWSETKEEWIYGYGIHLSVVATPRFPVFPFLAELTPANNKGIQILKREFNQTPKRNRTDNCRCRI